MNNIESILKSIGLTDKGSDIYLSLIENGKSNIAEISNHSGFHRMQIYREIPLLLEMGFVFETKIGKSKYYIPCNPSRIYEEQKRLVEESKLGVANLVEKFNSHDKKTNIVFNRGRNGIKNVYRNLLETLNDGDVFFRISSEVDLENIKTYYQPYNYLVKRDSKNIERMIILSEKSERLKIPKLEREVKIISSKVDEFDDNISFTIYGNKISFVDFNTETSIIIESDELSKYLEKIFKILYKRL